MANLPAAFMPMGQYLRMDAAASSDIPTSMFTLNKRTEQRPGGGSVHSAHEPDSGVSTQRTDLNPNPNPGVMQGPWPDTPTTGTTEGGLGWPTRERYNSRAGRAARDTHGKGKGRE
jgi:hypothetical protein